LDCPHLGNRCRPQNRLKNRIDLMTFPFGYEFVPPLAVAIHGISSGILAAYYMKKTERTKYFPLLFSVNFAIFAALLVAAYYIWNFQQLIDGLALIAYALVGGYVAAIEIPGYILLSRFDDRLEDELQRFRQKILILNFDFNGFPEVEATSVSLKRALKDLSIDDLVGHFVESSKRIKQFDRAHYDVTIKELNDSIRDVSDRSKHPFPKLIEILSLAGISFLIGQFLSHFLP
jgi:hypothetical protein